MCGIVGTLVFSNSDFEISDGYMQRMRDTMIHRGPDGAGTWISDDKKIGLGHRRLSIIDLSDNASQPMCNHDTSLWISFNGEIYNHAEIRSELIELGYTTWETDHSDTEVILYAYQCWGIDCLQRFRGMFAFSLWDASKQEMWLVRDRIGIKPLYYSKHHGRITFASEIKALLEDPEQKREVNEESLFHYLSFVCTSNSTTLFDGINKVPGGCYLRITPDGSVEKHQYWDPWDNVTPLQNLSETDIAERVLQELKTSVHYRKEGDVPIGVFLSGGIDSSTNTALFSEGENKPVHTFSIGYEGEHESYQNELQYARMIAEHEGTVHAERLLTLDDLLVFLPDMVKAQDEPIADPVCIPVYYVSKLARDKGMVVCQVGEGADELFWGYPSWRASRQLQRVFNMGIPKFVIKTGMAVLRYFNRSDRRYYEWFRRASLGQPIFWGGAESFTDDQKHLLFGERLNKKFEGRNTWDLLKPLWNDFQKKAQEKSILNWMSYLDLKLRLPELLLMRVDKMSMATSLECRVPFLDHNMVELALSIPEKIKTRGNTLKYILKKSVTGVIPDEIINRPKQGFGVPVQEYLCDVLGEKIEKGLHELCKETDYFDVEYIDELIKCRNVVALWTLYNFYLWWKEYI